MDESRPDRAAFRAFYDAHMGALYRFLYARIGNREEAEDLTAAVFTKVVRGMDWGQPEAARVAWLFQAARTTLVDHWRLHGGEHALSLDVLLEAGWEVADHPTADPATSAPLRAQVDALLAALPDNYRQVLRHRFLLGYTIKETALALGLSEANVKVLQLRALRRAATLEQLVPAQKGVSCDV